MDGEINQLRRKLDKVKGKLELALKENSELKKEIEQLKKDKNILKDIISADVKCNAKGELSND